MILWIDYLSVFSLFKTLKIVYMNRDARVYYFKTSRVAYILVSLINKLNIFKIETKKIVYSLGDMFVENQSLGLKAEIELPEKAHEVLKKIQERIIYKEIIKLLPSEKVAIYYEKKIREEVSFIVRILLIIQWYRIIDKINSENILICAYSPLIGEILSVWKDDFIKVRLYRSLEYSFFTIKRVIKLIYNNCIFPKSVLISQNNELNSNYSIAVHYREGLDINTRSDLFWYNQNKINPQNIIIFIDSINRLHIPPTSELCKQIESLNMRWINLHNGFLKVRHGKRIVVNSSRKESIGLPKFDKIYRDSLDRWIFVTAKELLFDLKFWLKLYKYLNIKICFDIGAQTNEAIAQAIALDFVDGIRVGVQRSTISMIKCLPFLRDNANHIFFTWGNEVNKHKGTSKTIKSAVVSGFPFDYHFNNLSTRNNIIKENQRIKTDRKEFIIALFDNVFTSNLYFSENMMCTFYRSFLEWMIVDDEVVIICKEKKPMSIERMGGLYDLISSACKTGRFIRLDNVLGRFPADASCTADMAVGIGISSAVMESVIAGCKGIHCDLPKQYSHFYYQMGYEKIIFDDMDRMMKALKSYKKDRNNVPGLGDWSAYLDKLDPFRDGRAHERIGSYINWCLGDFNDNKNREYAINHANNKYSEKWGNDKIIPMSELA